MAFLDTQRESESALRCFDCHASSEAGGGERMMLHLGSRRVGWAGTGTALREKWQIGVVTNDIIRYGGWRKNPPHEQLCIIKSDLLVINKIHHAPMVGASLEVTTCDTTRMGVK